MTELRRLGKYEILEEIGRGGFAVVYKARDITLDRIVALKVLHPQLTIDPKFVQRFHQEAQTAARLHHPHIVTIHEVGEEAGQHYLAMSFLPGHTLDERLSATRGPLPVELAISIIEQIADALDTIHQQGLVHRDIKPANVMVDSKGRATLLDFGIVRAAEGTRLTTSMAVLGTPEYMAPEQAELEEGEEVDWRVDVYALGVVAYEMLVGRPPFTGKSPTAILHKHAYEPPPAPTTLNASLPAALEPVLLQALAKRREERFQSAGGFAAELRRALLTDSQVLEREARLAPLYRQLQAAAAQENWRGVLVLGSRIQALDAGYRDVSQRMAHARQQLRQPQRAPTEPTPPLQPAPRGRAEEPERKARRTPALNWRVAGLSALPVLICICLIAGSLLRGIPGVEIVVRPRWTTFTTEDGLADDDVRAIAVGQDGALWFGTYGGVSSYDPDTGLWRTFTTEDGLASNLVRAVAVGPDGVLWFGTYGGVSSYDSGTGLWQTFTAEDGLTDNSVRAVAVGPDDVLWFGTSHGASRHDPATNSWQDFTNSDGLVHNQVFAIAIGSEGTLWFGTWGGVSSHDLGTGDWQDFTTKDGLAHNIVYAIAVGPDGALWFGTHNGGVSGYNPGTGDWQDFTTKDGLADDSVRAVAVGLDGALWFGTAGGVSRYGSGSGPWRTFRTFTAADDLVNKQVQAIAVESDGDLWFGTAGGVSRFEPTSP